MTKIAKTGIAGTGLALSALLAWSVAVAQSQSVTPVPAAAPAQVAQATMGITPIIAGTAGPAQVEGGLAATNAAIAGGFVAATGFLAASGLSGKVTGGGTGTK